MYRTARKRAGNFVIGGVLTAVFLLIPQYTYAFSVCDYLSFALKPFGLCTPTIVVATPTPPAPPTPEPIPPVVPPATPQATTVLSESTTTPTTTVSTTPTPTPDPDWEGYAKRSQALFASIVSYLERDNRRSSSNRDYVTRETFDKQTDRIFEVRSDSVDTLSDAFTTNLLTVTGTGAFSDYVSATTYTATDPTATSTFRGALSVGTTTSLDTLTLDGALYLASTIPTVASNRLYNNSGDLYWNGSVITSSTTGNWSGNGSDVYRLTGNVGVGTGSPSSVLTVGSPSSELTAIGNTGSIINSQQFYPVSFIGEYKGVGSPSSGSMIGLYQNTIGGVTVTSGNRLGGFFVGGASSASSLRNTAGVFGFASEDWIDSSAYGTYLSFATTPNGSVTRSEKMRIDSDGNVGIGTSTPSDKLHVASPVGDLGGILIDSRYPVLKLRDNDAASTTAGGAMAFIDNVGVQTAVVGFIESNHSLQINNYKDAGNIRLDAQGVRLTIGSDSGATLTGGLNIKDNGSLSEIFNITSNGGSDGDIFSVQDNGNVGIGTTNPGVALDIVGQARLQSGNAFNFRNPSNNAASQIMDTGASGETALTFRTNATNRMVIDNDGNVGIGTSTPASKLTVDGTASIFGSFGIADASPTVSISNESSKVDGLASKISFNNVAGAVDYESGISAVYRGGTLNANKNLEFFAGGNSLTPKLVIDGTGNVGIGTTIPATALNIVGDIRLTDTINPSYRYAEIGIKQANGYSDLTFSTSGAGGFGERMVIDSEGNVGIGTTSPDKLLSLASGDEAGIRLYTADNINPSVLRFQRARGDLSFPASVTAGMTSGQIVFAERGSEGVDFEVSRIEGGNTSATQGRLSFYTHPGAGNGSLTERVRIDENGNVGIGTTTPGAMLDIYQDNPTADQIIFRAGTSDDISRFTIDEDGDLAARNGSFNDLQLTAAGQLNWGVAGANGRINVLANAMRFNLNSSEMMRITSTGNVGIGTTTPASKLDISAEGVGNGNTLTFSGLRSQENTLIQPVRDNLLEGWKIKSGGGAQEFFHITDSSNNQRLTVRTDTGNVGIGTTNPGLILEAVGTLGSPVTSGTSQTGTLRVAQSSGGLVMDMGITTTGSNAGWIQPTNRTNLAVVYNLLLNPNGGNVGIGTTNPNQGLLHLHKTVGDLVVYGQSQAVGTNAILNLVSHASGEARIYFGDQDDGDQAGIVYNNIGDANEMQFYTNANQQMVIDSSGNVGIGTTGPGYKLEVNGDGYFNDSISLPRSDTGGIVFRSGPNYVGTIKEDAELRIMTDNKLIFQDIDIATGAEGTEWMIIDNGNVGIGTTSPGYRLDIEGSGDVFARINGTGSDAGIKLMEIGDLYGFTIQHEATGNDLEILRHSNSATGALAVSINRENGSFGIATSSSLAKFSVQTTGSDDILNLFETSGNEVFTVMESGNVGIGTTTPTFKLTVAGTIGPETDDTYNLGAAGNDWGCLYYNSGTLGTCASDERLKENIETLSFTTTEATALEKVAALELHTFNFKTAPNSQYAGLIAQEVLDAAPELVTENDDGFLAVRYGDIQWLVLEAVQDLWDKVTGNTGEIETLKEENEQLRERLEAIEAELNIEPEDDEPVEEEPIDDTEEETEEEETNDTEAEEDEEDEEEENEPVEELEETDEVEDTEAAEEEEAEDEDTEATDEESDPVTEEEIEEEGTEDETQDEEETEPVDEVEEEPETETPPTL